MEIDQQFSNLFCFATDVNMSNTNIYGYPNSLPQLIGFYQKGNAMGIVNNNLQITKDFIATLK